MVRHFLILRLTKQVRGVTNFLVIGHSGGARTLIHLRTAVLGARLPNSVRVNALYLDRFIGEFDSKYANCRIKLSTACTHKRYRLKCFSSSDAVAFKLCLA